MRRPTAPILVAIGLAVGAVAALGGAALAGDGNTAPGSGPTTSPTSAGPVAASAFRFSPTETTLGPTVLVPRALSLEENEVVLSYDLVDIATRPVGTFTRAEDTELPVAAPETWTLRTTSGDIPGRTATTRARTARFEVEDGFDLANIRSIRLDSWRTRLPLLHHLEIGHDDLEEYVLDDDTAVRLRRVLIQTNNSLVQLLVTHPGSLFSASTVGFGAAFEAQPQLRGVGPGWTQVGPIQGGVQLTFVGDLPDPMPLTVRTHSWVEIPGPVEIDMTGLLDG